MADFTREELDEIIIMASELRMIQDVEERTAEGFDLISFADGEKVTIPVPQEQRNQMAAKKTYLQGRLKERLQK